MLNPFLLGNVEFLRPALNKFLEQVVKLLLFDNLDSSVVDAASEALLSLICAERVSWNKPTSCIGIDMSLLLGFVSGHCQSNHFTTIRRNPTTTTTCI